jgi:phosphatidylserine decarboxylase
LQPFDSSLVKPLEGMDRFSGSSTEAPPAAAVSEFEAMDPLVTSIQPGGGVCMQIELAWGRLRRAYLKTFRRGYVERMRSLRQGDHNACPHEVLDPRDVKFYRNQRGYFWAKEDDPFTWRNRLPFARVGLAEVLILGGGFLALAVLLVAVFPPLAIAPAVCAAIVFWFFRNPRRVSPTAPGLVLSPADGKITTIEPIEYDEFIGGPAVLVGIFLSVVNVHINRAPVAGRVLGISYRRGKFLNALRPESARENEQLTVRMEEADGLRRFIVRQITGAIARRIVCWVALGDELQRGEQFGMIKLGSRTELVFPQDGSLTLEAKIGDRVKAGVTVLARASRDPAEDEVERR